MGNLLENASKFDADGDDPIEVRACQGEITVRDRGPGIAAADISRVFDRFYRADSARGLPGSGLGLAIVHDVAMSRCRDGPRWRRVGGYAGRRRRHRGLHREPVTSPARSRPSDDDRGDGLTARVTDGSGPAGFGRCPACRPGSPRLSAGIGQGHWYVRSVVTVRFVGERMRSSTRAA
ncbi:sensor histidine kinase [Streptomyces europaeiscabiei]|uniref:sensor histidine kinase n=1 Tax=Streptomyces europaeiscabiei TaxID=146819 RepID=UPI003990BF60